MCILYKPKYQRGGSMNETNRTEYIREYNKDTYKTVKVYIREEEYPAVMAHMKDMGYTKLSGYIKDLIARDMASAGAGDKTVNIGRDNVGTINM